MAHMMCPAPGPMVHRHLGDNELAALPTGRGFDTYFVRSHPPRVTLPTKFVRSRPPRVTLPAALRIKHNIIMNHEEFVYKALHNMESMHGVLIIQSFICRVSSLLCAVRLVYFKCTVILGWLSILTWLSGGGCTRLCVHLVPETCIVYADVCRVSIQCHVPHTRF